MRRRLRLVVAGTTAVLAAVTCALYGQQVREEAQRVRAEALERYGGEVVSLVVATKPIEAGQVIDRQNVSEREWLVDLAPAGAVRGIDEVLGTEVTVPAAEGAPLTELNFRDEQGALEVPEGLVAISVPLSDDLALPSSVEAGSTLAAYAVTQDGVRLVSGSVQVIGAASEQDGLLAAGELTLAVAPEDVAALLSASASGALRLALPSDDGALEESAQSVAPEEVAAEEDGSAGQDATGDDDAGSGQDASAVQGGAAEGAAGGGAAGGEDDVTDAGGVAAGDATATAGARDALGMTAGV